MASSSSGTAAWRIAFAARSIEAALDRRPCTLLLLALLLVVVVAIDARGAGALGVGVEDAAELLLVLVDWLWC